ncbi:MAG TPA: S9 family peptidase [Candidatus Acidoferrales bacterium]|nr:S9 family peptidase [Candidatus Acidoferrales bacterium]
MKFPATLLLLALCIGRSHAAGRPIELADYYRVETAATTAISPDGRWVVFVRNTIAESDNGHHSELWISPSDGSAPATRLTTPAFNASAPRWSPDGKVLAFRSTRRASAPGAAEPAGRGGGRRGAAGGESDIWFLRMDRPSGEAFQVPGVEGAPIFSPDNRWIAFTRTTPPARAPRELSPLERQLEQRFKGRIYDWMNARFDGRGYLPDPRDPAATPPAELYVVPRDGGAARQVTHLGVDVREPSWRPDSGALAFIADSHQRDEYSYERADLWIAALDGTVRRLTDDGFEYDSPAWSPDGHSLVFRRRQSLSQIIQVKQNHGAAVDVYRLPAEGGAISNLTAEWDLIPDSPVYGPDGRFVYFPAALGGDTQLFRIPSNGGRVEQLTRGERNLGGFSFSHGFDRMAFTASDALRPAEAFAARIDGGGECQLSSFNDAWIKDVDLARAERIHFPSKDGTQVEGWLMFPHTVKPPYALILSIHGGPHGAYGSAFNFEFQWLAANGYAVLFTNPRGSTGYGEKFLWATWGGWGKRDFEDVMAGVDYALERYQINPRRLGVTGYSYGGFMTDWTITQTDRFAAAVTGAGISNWLSDYGTADIPRTKESEFYGSPWESDSNQLMRSLSPITYAANVKTPTLFVHGEADMRVPIEEAEQMYTALKKRHVPAKFIRYPGNYHGGWPPWDMVHRYYQEVQWWREFLQ